MALYTFSIDFSGGRTQIGTHDAPAKKLPISVSPPGSRPPWVIAMLVFYPEVCIWFAPHRSPKMDLGSYFLEGYRSAWMPIRFGRQVYWVPGTYTYDATQPMKSSFLAPNIGFYKHILDGI